MKFTTSKLPKIASTLPDLISLILSAIENQSEEVAASSSRDAAFEVSSNNNFRYLQMAFQDAFDAPSTLKYTSLADLEHQS